jgi:manganese/zinc/iron transport system permease protein
MVSGGFQPAGREAVLSLNAVWIILTGALVAGSCGMLGCYLVLRRQAMLGDAISHALLPGIVLAFLITHSKASIPMFVGAVILGMLTTFLVQALSRGGVQGDAAIGVTFTSLFALGVVLVSAFAGQVDLDQECVLYGEIAYTPFDRFIVNGAPWGPPRPVLINGALLLLNLAAVALLYKELKICAFDPEMAAAVGINVAAVHYLLMGLVSVTVVGAFESVGAILVVAMLIVPGATAYLLTERLDRMLLLAVVTGALSSAGGYYLARALDCSIAGAMAAVAGGLFTLAFLFSPSHGFVTKRIAQQRLRRRVAEEDVLLWGGRRLEAGEPASFTARELSLGQEWLLPDAAATASRMARAGLLAPEGDRFSLSAAGHARAMELLRRHRLYESYLGDLGYPTDHLHGPADRAEHHLSTAMTAAVDAAAQHPTVDPQGRPIPPAE